jgi:quercetin dioxygenase-like cupin family protein
LDIAESIDLVPVTKAQVGLCRIGEGARSPPEGFRTSAAHEIAYVVRGRIRVHTESGVYDAAAGDVLTTSPAEPHSTTALEDCELFFVLLDPK